MSTPTSPQSGDPQDLLKQLQQLLGQQAGAAPQAAPPELSPELLAAAQQLLAQQQAAQAAQAAPPAQPDAAQLLAQLQQALAQQAPAAQPTQPVQPVAQPAPQPVQAAAPQPQYVPPQQFAQQPVATAPAKKRPIGLIAGITAAAVAVAAFGFTGFVAPGFLVGGNSENEIFLEAATDLGRSPFSATSLAQAPNTGLATATAPAAVTAAIATAPVSGGTAGIYGGSLNLGVCDAAGMITFLAANPDKAKAWVDALNTDPTVRLANGDPLTVDNMGRYISSLTTVVLTYDTRVTNHGFRNGAAYQINSTLQKGTAVLVDDKGVPRAKCNCGNPLIPAKATPGAPTIVGDPWRDFDPNEVKRVDPSPDPIYVFVLVDIDSLLSGNLTYFNRLVGSDGTGGDVQNDGTDPNEAVIQALAENPPTLQENASFSVDVPTFGLPVNTSATGTGTYAGAPAIVFGTEGDPTFVQTSDGATPDGWAIGYYTGEPRYAKVTEASAVGADAVAEVSKPYPSDGPDCRSIVEAVSINGWTGVKSTKPACAYNYESDSGSWYSGSDTPRVQYGLNSRDGHSLVITFNGGFNGDAMLPQILSTFTKK